MLALDDRILEGDASAPTPDAPHVALEHSKHARRAPLVDLASSRVSRDVLGFDVEHAAVALDDLVVGEEDSILDVDTAGIMPPVALLALADSILDVGSTGAVVDTAGFHVEVPGVDVDTAGIHVDEPRCELRTAHLGVDAGGVESDTGGIDVSSLFLAIEENSLARRPREDGVDSGGDDVDTAGIIAACEVFAFACEGFARDTRGITLSLPLRPVEDPMKQDDIRPLSRALYAWRTENSLTQDEMADELGISRKTYVFFESSRWFPPHKERAHFLRLLRDLDESLAQAFVDVLGTTIADHAVVLTPEEAEQDTEIDDAAARNAVDVAVYATADRFDMTAKALREIVGAVLAKLAESGVPMRQAARIANAKR